MNTSMSSASFDQHKEQTLVFEEKVRPSNRLKGFLMRHSNFVDFLCSSLIICVCLTVLLPRVHESFTSGDHQLSDGHEAGEITSIDSSLDDNYDLLEMVQQNISTDDPLETVNPSSQNAINQEHNHSGHTHNHKFPIGEVLICIGFFVFYCIGMRMDSYTNTNSTERALLLDETRRPNATVCCSSTRCPTTRPSNNSEVKRQTVLVVGNEQEVIKSLGPQTIADGDKEPNSSEKDCLLLLNRHHQHHTHIRHHSHEQSSSNWPTRSTTQRMTHDHGQSQIKGRKRSDYGTRKLSDDQNFDHVQDNDQTDNHDDGLDINHQLRKSATSIVVDEIRIVSTPQIYAKDIKLNQCWPQSIKMLLVSLVLAGFLILFDMNVFGLLKTLRVFRAASTGALLYVAFFIMLPNQSAGCNSCAEQET